METRSGKMKKFFVCLVAVAVALNTVFVAMAFESSADNTVRIGQACCDEKGGVKGGKAGDQTGREVVIGNWSYNSSKSAFNHWVYVFRAKDPTIAKRLAKKMKEACENDHIGYDQRIPDRYSFHDEAEKVGWDIKAIKKNCETTCTSCMAVCLNAVGIPTRKIWTVNHVYNDLMATGQFKVYKTKKYTASKKYLEPGDILLSSCHGAMVVESGNAAGTTDPAVLEEPIADANPAFTIGKNYQLTTHLYVRKGPGKEYTVKFRKDLTDYAKKYAEDNSFAILNSGTVITCLETYNGWIRIPSGWICGTRDGYMFVESYLGTEEQLAAYKAAKNPEPSEQTTTASTTTSTTTTTTSAASTTTSTSTKTSTTTTKKTTTKKKTTKKTTKKKKKTTKKKSKKLVIKKYKDYKLATTLYVRTGPGKDYRIKNRSELTEDGKKHAQNCTEAILKKGTEVTCLEVQGDWMRIPSGWVCCKPGNMKKAS